jgi:hypothetical protein
MSMSISLCKVLHRTLPERRHGCDLTRALGCIGAHRYMSLFETCQCLANCVHEMMLSICPQVRRELETPIAKEILSGKYAEGDTILVDVINERIGFKSLSGAKKALPTAEVQAV